MEFIMDTYSSLIVFEGLDGAGTTTQIKRLAAKIEKAGRKVFLTHEPTDNPIGKVVRQVLQHKIKTTPEALALLYSSDRDDHLYNPEYGIKGYIENDYIVLSDRYFYSSIAYQGVECDIDFVERINRFPHAGLLIFVDTPVDSCMGRIDKRGEEKELFDRADFLKKVRDNYIRQTKNLPEETSLLVIDGDLPIEIIEEKIWEGVKKYLSI